MEYELMNISYNLINGQTIAWNIGRDDESDGAFYLNDRRQLCVESNGETLDEVKGKMKVLISNLADNCDMLLKDMDSWKSFEALKAAQVLFR